MGRLGIEHFNNSRFILKAIRKCELNAVNEPKILWKFQV